jgi:ribosomal protein L32
MLPKRCESCGANTTPGTLCPACVSELRAERPLPPALLERVREEVR